MASDLFHLQTQRSVWERVVSNRYKSSDQLPRARAGRRRLCSLYAQQVKHNVGGLGGLNQGVNRRNTRWPPALNARQYSKPLMAHPNLHCRRGISYKHDEREIVRRVVDEIDEFRDLRGYDSAEQQTDCNREHRFHLYRKRQNCFPTPLYNKENACATIRIIW